MKRFLPLLLVVHSLLGCQSDLARQTPVAPATVTSSHPEGATGTITWSPAKETAAAAEAAAKEACARRGMDLTGADRIIRGKEAELRFACQ
jgi:hypothetical protein